MKVLITGIGGFAGSHLTDYIAANTSAEIYGVLRDSEKDDNLLQHGDKIVLSRGEITDFQSIFMIIKEVKPDIIFHVAGQAFVPSSFEHAADTFKTNVIGTINIFEAVKAAEISPRIIVVTSGEIYAKPSVFQDYIPNNRSRSR